MKNSHPPQISLASLLNRSDFGYVYKRLLVFVSLIVSGVLIGFFFRGLTQPSEKQNAVTMPEKSAPSRSASESFSSPGQADMALEIKTPTATAAQGLGQKWRPWFEEALLGGKGSLPLGKLPEVEIQKYLAANSSDPDAWIVAAYLREGKPSFRDADMRFPRDPSIQVRMAMWTDDPSERRSAIQKFRAVDPLNALGDYLSALEYLKQGRQREALQDLAASLNKIDVDDYARQLIPAYQEAYLSAGYQGMEAELAALMSTPRDVLSQLGDLSKQLKNLQATSDAETAASIRSAGLALGQNLQHSEFLIDQLVGMRIEQQFLNPSSDANRLNEISLERAEISRLTKNVKNFLLQASPSITSGYIERLKTLGERQALQWLEIQTAAPSEL